MSDLNNVNLRTLQFFISVYDCQSFSEVARREGVSASMISRMIKQLEDALGQQLFYRNTRSIIPTEAGRLFIEYARNVADQFGLVQTAFMERQQTPTGRVRINAPVYFGQKHIAPWLSGLSQRYPNLTLDLTLTDDFIDPHKEAADVLFRIGTLSDSSYHARPLAIQTYYLAASPTYLSTHPPLRAPEALSQHQILIYKGSSGPNRWLFKKGNGSWYTHTGSPLLTSNNAQALIQCALQHMGLVLFPDWLIGEYLQSGQLQIQLSDYQAAIHTEPQSIAAIYPYARHPSRNVRAVIDYFVEIYGDPAYWTITTS